MNIIKKKTYSAALALPFQTVGEEIANAILHGIGTLGAIAGLIVLLLRSKGFLGGIGGGIRSEIAYSIFAGTLIAMFLASTLYHAIQHKGAKRIFRILDHSAIYLLIAGTYTPLCLIAMRGALGWTFFGVEWACAAIGITLYTTNCRFIKKFELAIYLLMGWVVVFGMSRLFKSLPLVSFILLIAGGIAYTLGTIWYAKGPTRRKTHVIWHIFVLAGAICHWFSILLMS
ncbi:hemolysin D [Spirochaetia bacterium]|nr:hemolysin D [Spirochaetia bacterium]GHU32376.1 hemolysin D [Spirochaetia bacterium]